MQVPKDSKSKKFTQEKSVKIQRMIRRTCQVYLLMIMGSLKVLDREHIICGSLKKKVIVSGITDVRTEWHDIGSLHGLSSLDNQMRYLYHSI